MCLGLRDHLYGVGDRCRVHDAAGVASPICSNVVASTPCTLLRVHLFTLGTPVPC